MLNWKNLKEKQPELFDIIIIALNEDDLTDHSKWLIGQYLQSDDKSFYGVVIEFDETGKDIAIKFDRVKFWSPLFEGGHQLPLKFKEEDLPIFYEAFRKMILSYEYRFLVIAKLSKTASGKVYPLDLYLDGIYNRALSLIYATLTLLDSKNYMAAASIVRLHLDNFLRLNAAWLVEKPHDFVMEVMDGTPIKRIKDRNEKKMLDGYLVDEASKTYPWIKEVYEKACGFVHFSSTHIFSNQKIANVEERTIDTYIGKSDWDNVTDKSRIEVLAVMIEISDCILQLAYGWARTKMQENDLDLLRRDTPT
jgi:hypothetical protein